MLYRRLRFLLYIFPIDNKHHFLQGFRNSNNQLLLQDLHLQWRGFYMPLQQIQLHQFQGRCSNISHCHQQLTPIQYQFPLFVKRQRHSRAELLCQSELDGHIVYKYVLCLLYQVTKVVFLMQLQGLKIIQLNQNRNFASLQYMKVWQYQTHNLAGWLIKQLVLWLLDWNCI